MKALRIEEGLDGARGLALEPKSKLGLHASTCDI